MPTDSLPPGVRVLQLTRGLTTIIDEADFEKVGHLKWFAQSAGKSYYAARHTSRRSGKHRVILLHRVLLDAPAGMDVDHRNGDTLDNRRLNLRIATRSENNSNSHRVRGKSRFKGVCRANNQTNPWQAEITVNRKRYHLGHFPTEEDAARAYDRAAREYGDEFACTNADLFGEY